MTNIIPRNAAYFQERSRLTESGCWEWTLSAYKGGNKRGGLYGRARCPEEGRNIGSHVLAYKSLIGPIPEGHHVDHTCRNTLCCNPEHLEAVTPAENNRRRGEAGDCRNQNTEKTNCPKCGEPYTGQSSRSDGRTFQFCVPCMKAYQADRYQANRERIRARQNAAYAARKAGT